MRSLRSLADKRWVVVLPALLVALFAQPGALSAQQQTQQDSAHVKLHADSDTVASHRRGRPPPPKHDYIKPPISPGRALLYSMLVPGLGQAKLDEPYTGAFFFAIEAVSIAQVRQAIIDRNYNAHHTSDSVVSSYQNDGVTGTPLADTTGAPIPTGYVYNRYAPTAASDRLGARRLHVEDWIALLIFNHLISGADAFVSAELWDLPQHVTAFRTNDGRMVFALSFSVR
jgi:hypothetical protein